MIARRSGRAILLMAVMPVTMSVGGAGASRSVAPPMAVRSVSRALAQTQGPRAAVPWGVGEQLIYDVKFGPIKVGAGSMEVVEIETIRGREAYRTIFHVRGGTVLYSVNDVFQSWIDTETLSSLRFVKDQEEGRKQRNSRFEIYPERQTFSENDQPEERSVASPLDDGSFLYFVRTLPLRTGDAYEFSRYFRPDRNPVRIRVLRRERVTVPAGTFDAVVVQPTIKAKGIFSEGGRAEVWISDDADRMVLQVKSSLSFGSLNMFLRSRRLGTK
jgi:hypothetical protein